MPYEEFTYLTAEELRGLKKHLQKKNADIRIPITNSRSTDIDLAPNLLVDPGSRLSHSRDVANSWNVLALPPTPISEDDQSGQLVFALDFDETISLEPLTSDDDPFEFALDTAKMGSRARAAGLAQSFRRLKEHGVRMIVVTNNKSLPIKKVLAILGLGEWVREV